MSGLFFLIRSQKVDLKVPFRGKDLSSTHEALGSTSNTVIKIKLGWLGIYTPGGGDRVFFLHISLTCLCACVCGGVCAYVKACIWRSAGLVLSFHPTAPRDLSSGRQAQ